MESLYATYFKDDKTSAEAKGECWWPCKIGYSNNPPKRTRCLNTGTYKRLELGLTYETANGLVLESFVHGKLREKRIGDGGDEWFLTNPFLTLFSL